MARSSSRGGVVDILSVEDLKNLRLLSHICQLNISKLLYQLAALTPSFVMLRAAFTSPHPSYLAAKEVVAETGKGAFLPCFSSTMIGTINWIY